MVARDTTVRRVRSGLARFADGLWRRWRSLVARLAPAARAVARVLAPAVLAVARAARSVRAVRDPRSSAAAASRPEAAALAGAGAFAFAAGAAARIAIAAALREPLASVAVAVVTSACWALGRRVVFAVLRRQEPRGPASGVTAAWAIGLLPYAVAVRGPLVAVAFAASAVLTFRGLEGAFGDRRRALALCALTYGAEAVGGLTAWVVVNGLVVLPALG